MPLVWYDNYSTESEVVYYNLIIFCTFVLPGLIGSVYAVLTICRLCKNGTSKNLRRTVVIRLTTQWLLLVVITANSFIALV